MIVSFQKKKRLIIIREKGGEAPATFKVWDEEERPESDVSELKSDTSSE